MFRRFIASITRPKFLIYLVGIIILTVVYEYSKRVWGNSWLLVGPAIVTLFIIRKTAIFVARKLENKNEIDSDE